MDSIYLFKRTLKKLKGLKLQKNNKKPKALRPKKVKKSKASCPKTCKHFSVKYIVPYTDSKIFF